MINVNNVKEYKENVTDDIRQHIKPVLKENITRECQTG